MKLDAEGMRKELREKLESIRASAISTLAYVGEKCVEEARNNGSYRDFTGNLRSSVGYAVMDNGSVAIKGGFEKVKDGSDGQSEGNSLLGELSSKYSSGIVLVVVAGMDYAALVESRGQNVLASAELLAATEVPRLLKEIALAS